MRLAGTERNAYEISNAVSLTLSTGFGICGERVRDICPRLPETICPQLSPRYYGMWYKADRFVNDPTTQKEMGEYYRWDRFMSDVTGVTYPFDPTPFDWEYGAGRKFNLPDYNNNDWR